MQGKSSGRVKARQSPAGAQRRVFLPPLADHRSRPNLESSACPRPLKIALVSDFYLPRVGGLEMQMSDLARALHERGHEVHVITTTPGPPQDGAVPVHRMTVAMVKGYDIAFPSFSQLIHLQRLFRREKFEVIHAHSILSPCAVGGLLEACRLRIGSVLTNHSMLSRHPVFMGLTRSVFAFWAFRAQVVTAVSEASAAETRKACRREEVLVLPNGVDLAGWHRIERASAELRVASVMRLTSRKEPVDLLKAIPQTLARVSQPVRFSIIGDGPERARMEEMARRLGIADRVDFLGRRSRREVQDILAQSDIFVLPGRNEAFGIAALEARCAGLPVVAMHSGGLPEIIEHERTGLLARVPQEFADHLVRLINDPELRTRLGENTRHGLERYDWDRVVERHLEVYSLAIERREAKNRLQ